MRNRGTEATFSQWYPARFDLAGKVFHCAEQYMMYGKAILFGDAEIAAEILEAVAPKQHKALGRKVRNFSDAIWKANREAIVGDGSRAKFTQNPELRQALLDTAGTELVEASPFDRIWGSASPPRTSARRTGRSGAVRTCSARS